MSGSGPEAQRRSGFTSGTPVAHWTGCSRTPEGNRCRKRSGRSCCAEGEPGTPPAALADIVASTDRTIEQALEQLRATDVSGLLEERRVGRAGLPSNPLGLLFHAAEHSTRHAGQAITTARILSGRGLS